MTRRYIKICGHGPIYRGPKNKKKWKSCSPVSHKLLKWVATFYDFTLHVYWTFFFSIPCNFYLFYPWEPVLLSSFSSSGTRQIKREADVGGEGRPAAEEIHHDGDLWPPRPSAPPSRNPFLPRGALIILPAVMWLSVGGFRNTDEFKIVLLSLMLSCSWWGTVSN